jgi:hypothetical protein
MNNKRRWIFALDGARYCQEGDYIYSHDGQAEFLVANGWWHPIHGGAAAYYVRGIWVYSQDAKPAFYYD